jgi:hypothetical protein
MRYFFLFFVALSLPGLAFSQAAAAPGYATSSVVAPGTYAAPFVPRITTPLATLSSAPLEVGARNATAGNTAGASSATPTEPVPVNRGGLAPEISTSFWMEAQVAGASSQAASSPEVFNPGASMPQDAFGAAQLANGRAPNRPALRKFSNGDLPQTNNPAR